MINRFASLTLIIALVCTVGGTSAFADTPTNTDTNGNAAATVPASPTSDKKEGQPNEKLRAGLTKLVADTKAGKGTLSALPQFKPARSNNLSKGKKIAIGVGIAAVVAIVVIHARRHLFDDLGAIVLR